MRRQRLPVPRCMPPFRNPSTRTCFHSLVRWRPIHTRWRPLPAHWYPLPHHSIRIHRPVDHSITMPAATIIIPPVRPANRPRSQVATVIISSTRSIIIRSNITSSRQDTIPARTDRRTVEIVAVAVAAATAVTAVAIIVITVPQTHRHHSQRPAHRFRCLCRCRRITVVFPVQHTKACHSFQHLRSCRT